jgi:hypothetical protein
MSNEESKGMRDVLIIIGVQINDKRYNIILKEMKIEINFTIVNLCVYWKKVRKREREGGGRNGKETKKLKENRENNKGRRMEIRR